MLPPWCYQWWEPIPQNAVVSMTVLLKMLGKEFKYFWGILGKLEQLQRAHCWSSECNENCQKPFKVSEYCRILPGLEEQFCIWHSFSLTMFWECLLSFHFYLSLLTSIFPLWFIGLKELIAIFLLRLIITMHPSQMVVKLSYNHYIRAIFCFYQSMFCQI